MPQGEPEPPTMSETLPQSLSLPETVAFLESAFPQMEAGGKTYHLVEVGPGLARMRMDHHERHLRPGGTVSGPSMMALADYALYAAILASLGPVALAVTTSLTFNFLRKPGPSGLIGTARLLKLGKRLAVGEVHITGPEGGALVCHATGTYAIPPAR